MANCIGLKLRGIFLGQRVDVEPVNNALDFGFDPAVAVQGPVDTARHQGFIVHPGDGGLEFTGRCKGMAVGLMGQQPVAARYIHFAVQHNACAVACQHRARRAHMIEHLRHQGGLPAGQD